MDSLNYSITGTRKNTFSAHYKESHQYLKVLLHIFIKILSYFSKYALETAKSGTLKIMSYNKIGQ